MIKLSVKRASRQIDRENEIVLHPTMRRGPGRVAFEALERRILYALDATFGVHGQVVLDWTQIDQATSAAVDAQGRVLVAGITWEHGYAQPSVTRLLPDGTLDTSFGAGGIGHTDFRNGGG